MNATSDKPTIRELRAEAQRLGVTAESAGCPVEELIRAARASADPLGYLAIHAPGGDEGERGEGRGENATAPNPRIPESPNPETDDPIGDVPAPIPPQVEPAKIKTVIIEAPLIEASLDNTYLSRHVETRLAHEQAANLRKLFMALDAGGERLSNGRRVIHAADAVKWLLEQIG